MHYSVVHVHFTEQAIWKRNEMKSESQCYLDTLKEADSDSQRPTEINVANLCACSESKKKDKRRILYIYNIFYSVNKIQSVVWD